MTGIQLLRYLQLRKYRPAAWPLKIAPIALEMLVGGMGDHTWSSLAVVGMYSSAEEVTLPAPATNMTLQKSGSGPILRAAYHLLGCVDSSRKVH